MLVMTNTLATFTYTRHACAKMTCKINELSACMGTTFARLIKVMSQPGVITSFIAMILFVVNSEGITVVLKIAIAIATLLLF